MTRRPYDAVVLVHRVRIEGQRKPGGLDLVLGLLRQRGWRLLLVEHPLDGRGPSVLLDDGGERRRGLAWCRWLLLRWLVEPWWTTRAVRRALAPRAGTVALCADPLNAVAGWRLQQRGLVSRYAFHLADFSARRFGRPWLDAAYLRLFRFAARRAAVITAVSSRIVDALRQVPGLDRSRILRFPNSPVAGSLPRHPIEARRPDTLVMVAGSLSSWVGLEPVLDGVRLARQTLPSLTLTIVGGFLTPAEAARMTERVRARELDGVVTVTGFLPHARAVELAAGCRIGLAWYADDSAWSHYCDSMKIWEYAACGLPVVANRVSGTADDIQQAGGGYAVETPAALAEAIAALCRDPARYARMAEQAARWADAHDKRRLVEELIARLRP